MPSSGLTITPSRPAPSKRESHSEATTGSRVIGVRWIGGLTSASSCSSSVAALALRRAAHVAAVGGEQIERDELRRRLLRELGDARRGRMQPELQRVEVEAARRRDHDLAVEHAAGRQRVEKRGVQLGKVAIERLEIAALDEHVGAAAKDDRAKSVPLRLVQERPALPAAPRRASRASARRAARSRSLTLSRSTSISSAGYCDPGVCAWTFI